MPPKRQLRRRPSEMVAIFYDVASDIRTRPNSYICLASDDRQPTQRRPSASAIGLHYGVWPLVPRRISKVGRQWDAPGRRERLPDSASSGDTARNPSPLSYSRPAPSHTRERTNLYGWSPGGFAMSSLSNVHSIDFNSRLLSHAVPSGWHCYCHMSVSVYPE